MREIEERTDDLEKLRLDVRLREDVERLLQEAAARYAAGEREGRVARHGAVAIEWADGGVVVQAVDPGVVEDVDRGMAMHAEGTAGVAYDGSVGPLTERLPLRWSQVTRTARRGLVRKQQAPAHAALREYRAAASRSLESKQRLGRVDDELAGLPPRPERRWLREPRDPYRGERVRLGEKRRAAIVEHLDAARVSEEAAGALKRFSAGRDDRLHDELREVAEGLRDLEHAEVLIGSMQRQNGRAREREGLDLGPGLGR